MREVMRDGQTGPRVDLAGVSGRPDAYAVGALEGLRGEVTIHGGTIWITRVEGGAPHAARGPGGDQATLLTVARVRDWESVEITEPIEGPALERFIEQAAAASGIDTSVPFPFVLTGDADELAIHVINGFCPHAVDPKTLDAEPWRWSGDPGVEVTIVGFYAPASAGVMTHHGTAIHAHAIVTVDGRELGAHLDGMRTGRGMTLTVPGETWPHRRK